MSDLIDRQAAIEAYGDWYVEEGTEDGFIGTVKQLLEGFPSAQLGTNLASLGTDLISRQAAIDALDEIEAEVAEGFGFEYEKWRKYFCDLPPAQPAQHTPDQNGDIWITVPDIDEVTCVYVQESKSKFCRIFYEER